jgi:sortase A
MNPQDNPLLDPNAYNLPAKHGRSVQPLNKELKTEGEKTKEGASEAVSLIRDKLDKIYTKEPDAKVELAEAEAAGRRRSKHQQFMYALSTSGKSLAEIQTAWHKYYVDLPNEEKHQVWQEFYAEHSRAGNNAGGAKPNHEAHNDKPPSAHVSHTQPKHRQEPRSVGAIKSELINRVAARGSAKKGKTSHSLVFGLAMGGIVALFMMFGLFNERFIAPFITPSKSVSNTPIIIDPSTTAVGPEPKVIIPKINVEIPIVFDEESTEEAAIQRALEEGVIHYATTSNPGEQGNGAIFGHSSNNILNKGKYKFAFVLLRRLESGDVFYVQKDGKRFAYRVYKKTVVSPDQVAVLGAQDKPSTMSLITCDPPGTSLNRLVVVGEQISPDPSTNVASTANQETTSPAVLPSNSPSLWSRLTSWLSS